MTSSVDPAFTLRPTDWAFLDDELMSCGVGYRQYVRAVSNTLGLGIDAIFPCADFAVLQDGSIVAQAASLDSGAVNVFAFANGNVVVRNGCIAKDAAGRSHVIAGCKKQPFTANWEAIPEDKIQDAQQLIAAYEAGLFSAYKIPDFNVWLVWGADFWERATEVLSEKFERFANRTSECAVGLLQRFNDLRGHTNTPMR